MSHTTTIKGISIKDGDVIAKAIANLQAKGVNCSLRTNATPRMYYRQQEADVGNCEYVMNLPDSKYDVGFKKQADGSYAPVFDEWAGDVARNVGGTCKMPTTPEERSLWAIGQFSQEYAKEAAIKAAQAQGYYVENADIDADGNVNLVFATM